MLQHYGNYLAVLMTTVCALAACERATPPVDSLEVASRGLHSACLAPDAQYFALGSVAAGASLWSIPERARRFNWNHQDSDLSTVVACDFSPDSQWALTAEPSTLVLWRTEEGSAERYWQAPGEILDVALGPSARIALLGLSDHTAVVFNTLQGGVARTFQHENRVRAVDLNRDGTLALTGAEDNRVKLWDLRSGQLRQEFTHDDAVQLVRLSADGSHALSVSQYDRALIWRTDSGAVVSELALGDERIKRGTTLVSAAFSDDNSRLISGRPDQVIQLWEVASGQEIQRWRAPKRRAWQPTSAAVLAVSFGPKGEHYALASNGFLHWLNDGL